MSMPCDEMWIYVSLEQEKSAVYFEWENETPESPNKKKGKKPKKANKKEFRYFIIDGVLDWEVWEGLSSSQIHLKLNTYNAETSEMIMDVFLKKSGLAKLSHPSDITARRDNISKVSLNVWWHSIFSFISISPPPKKCLFQLSYTVEPRFTYTLVCV